MEFVGQLKNIDGINADGEQSVFILAILEKRQRNETNIFSRKCNSLINNCKLSRSNSYTVNTKNKTGTI